MTITERNAIQKLNKFWGAYIELPQQHPDELNEARNAVHRLQELIAIRIVRRDYPEGWPTHS